jgi:hypothetical protein
MAYAEDMSRLRQEIEELRSSRIALKNRLHHFATDLRRAMNEQRAAMRDHNVEQAAKTRDLLASFVGTMRNTMRDTLGGFQRERHNAHRGWMRMGSYHAGGRKAG